VCSSISMKRLAADNKIPGGDMTVFLRANGVPPQALRDQVRAALTWNKIVMRTVRPSINIGDDEIDAAVQRLRANAGKQEFLLSEIFLAVDKPEDETSAKALADNLVEQIKDGAVFGVVARQFSQGLGASNGGDLGWIQLGQLAPEIDKALAQMKKGDIVGPIRSANGYHILGLRDRRTLALGDSKDMSVHLQQLFHPFTADTRKETLLHQAADIRANTTSCDGLQQTIEQNYPSWRWQDLGDVALDKAPAWLADKVAPIEEGHATKAMATTKGALILFVCKRNMPENLDRNAIQRAIGTERLELMARRLQRDLRKDAFIDVRKKTPF
ncbi:MAG: peptidylprolyl isomerase, partial [Bdellovibrionales bacterium]